MASGLRSTGQGKGHPHPAAGSDGARLLQNFNDATATCWCNKLDMTEAISYEASCKLLAKQNKALA